MSVNRKDEASSGSAISHMRLPPTISPTSTFSSIHMYSTLQQLDGYKYVRAQADTYYTAEPLHPFNEDVALSATTPHGLRIHLLADGHAGHQAPHFFTKRLMEELMILFAVEFNLMDGPTRTLLANAIKDVFMRLDLEYVGMKTREYIHWTKNGGALVEEKPMDDGCTMVCNVVGEGVVLNFNVGDSRTVIASMHNNQLKPIFSSTDHNMSHPAKAHDIRMRGGKFLNPFTTTLMNVETTARRTMEYVELQHARLFRPISRAVQNVGCSHRRTLNLTGTMGDLLFKIEPAVLTAMPDVTFVDLPTDVDVLMIMATDGLWDHLSSTTAESQISNVLSYISNSLASGHDDACSLPSNSSVPSLDETSSVASFNTLAILDRIALDLVHREKNDMFVQDLGRYDDISVQLVYMGVE